MSKKIEIKYSNLFLFKMLVEGHELMVCTGKNNVLNKDKSILHE